MSIVTSEDSSRKFVTTRNYTGEDEKFHWGYIYTYIRDWKWWFRNSGKPCSWSKQEFRTRRNNALVEGPKSALRIRFGSSDEIGTFVKLTNTYLLAGDGPESERFCRTLKGDLPNINVIQTSLAGCQVIGCMCVGNKYGLLVPDTICDTELQKLKEEVPDSVEVKQVEERLSALGNVVVCNDSVALIHPDLDKETEEIIANTLQVEVFRCTVATNPLVGSYCILNNNGGLVCNNISDAERESLSTLLQLPLAAGSVNNGNNVVASGLIVNDSIAYAGMKTTSTEFTIIEKIFLNKMMV